MSTITNKKLTDHKVLIFDVYGTLADWETGIYNALQPLLERYPATRAWSRHDALKAFMSVESDLQGQYPGMLYSDLLANVHEVLEERLKALSDGATETARTALTEASVTSTTGAGPSDPNSASKSVDEHKAFGASIRSWPIFPDTCDALKRLSKHFKLVVLSNVDRESFRYTHALLSEGPTWDTVSSNISLYTYPDPNPNKFWHPQATPGSKSPFTLIVTAQDVGCYKPELGGFLAVYDYANTHQALFGDLELKDGEVVKDKVLSVAQSIPHDHVATKRLDMRSVWIDRQSAVTCNVDPDGLDATKWTWRYATLADMADAVEKELAAS
ncbi:haloacid dehalogenase [Gymnopilus junonius]|uniref:Haloacid dehalogenase n=1 Tax=Gymnopilus junonius TaxID=109634 RepID=A0A9P5NQV6_GYMJU|nr:haloacid dehalogenase [Gymnopilus junonius]